MTAAQCSTPQHNLTDYQLSATVGRQLQQAVSGGLRAISYVKINASQASVHHCCCQSWAALRALLQWQGKDTYYVIPLLAICCSLQLQKVLSVQHGIFHNVTVPQLLCGVIC